MQNAIATGFLIDASTTKNCIDSPDTEATAWTAQPTEMDPTVNAVEKITTCVKTATVSLVIVTKKAPGVFNVTLKENVNASPELLEINATDVR